MFGLSLQMSFFIGLVAALVLAAIVGDWMRRRNAKAALRHRQAFDDDAFRNAFYSGDPGRGAIAVRVRRVLEENLSLSLDTVRPDDRLDEQLAAELGTNPMLFLALEQELDIDTGFDDLEVFERTAKEIDTFSDLVHYVHGRVGRSKKPKPPDPSDAWLSVRLYERLVTIVPPACLLGLGLGVAGSLFGFERLWPIGSGIFVLGVVLIVISFFAIGIENLTLELRSEGIAWTRAHPLRTLWIGLLVAAMVYGSIRMLLWVLALFRSAP